MSPKMIEFLETLSEKSLWVCNMCLHTNFYLYSQLFHHTPNAGGFNSQAFRPSEILQTWVFQFCYLVALYGSLDLRMRLQNQGCNLRHWDAQSCAFYLPRYCRKQSAGHPNLSLQVTWSQSKSVSDPADTAMLFRRQGCCMRFLLWSLD